MPPFVMIKLFTTIKADYYDDNVSPKISNWWAKAMFNHWAITNWSIIYFLITIFSYHYCSHLLCNQVREVAVDWLKCLLYGRLIRAHRTEGTNHRSNYYCLKGVYGSICCIKIPAQVESVPNANQI